MMYVNNAIETRRKPPCCDDPQPVSAATAQERLAKLLTIKTPENIYFTDSGHQALTLALTTYCSSGHIISTGLEAEDTLGLFDQQAAAGAGFAVSYLPVNAYGKPLYEQLEGLIRPDTTAIFCTHGDIATGNVADLAQICTIARRHKLPVIADGRQTAGGVSINLEEAGVDVYIFTGEKALMGPKTIGGIYVRQGDDTIAEAAAAAAPGAEAVSALAASVGFILDKGIYGITMLPHRLAKRFFESSKAMDAVTVYGDYGTKDRLPYVAITVDGFTAEEIQKYMADRKVLISIEKGKACFSFAYFNNRRQVTRLVLKLMDMIGIDDMYLVP